VEIIGADLLQTGRPSSHQISVAKHLKELEALTPTRKNTQQTSHFLDLVSDIAIFVLEREVKLQLTF